MQWSDIRKQYPDKFILLGNLVEEKISERCSRIVGGTVLYVSDNAQEIRREYRHYQQQGQNVIYSLPTTTEDFVVEDVPFMGLLQ